MPGEAAARKAKAAKEEAALRAKVEADGAVDLRLDSALEEVDLKGRRVKLANHDDWQPYSKLVSTIPLPELIKRIQGAPAHIREAAAALRCHGSRRAAPAGAAASAGED